MPPIMMRVRRRKIPGLYSFIKFLCRTLFHIFFRDFDAFHTAQIPTDEPLLVIANHGNYLLDGLALLATYPGQISFLMAQPNFKTAIGGIARKIGAIPVLRPQDVEKVTGNGTVTISTDGSSVSGDGIGWQLNVGDTIYIECGTFDDETRDSRVTQCYGVISEIISDHEARLKSPGLKWIPASLTSERDIAYVKQHKIVNYGSLRIRVERGNTWVGINQALEGQPYPPEANRGNKTEIERFKQRFSLPTSSRSQNAGLENGSCVGHNNQDSPKAPRDINTTESTPLLRRSQPDHSTALARGSSRPEDLETRVMSAVPMGIQNQPLSSHQLNQAAARLSYSTTYSSIHGPAAEAGVSDVFDEEETTPLMTSHYQLPNGSTMLFENGGPDSSHAANDVSPTSTQSPGSPVATPNFELTTGSSNGLSKSHFPGYPCPFQYTRMIDHSKIYESVWKNFGDNRTVAVFPEGVSSDDYHLLDFKYGCTIMVLGYLAHNPGRDLKVIPCGLNFFNRHRFRSRFYADYGAPITVPTRLVEMFREGGDAKKQACTELLQIFYGAVEGLTLNAPSYDELRLYKATRRLYSTGKKLSVPQKLELTRRFARGYGQLSSAMVPAIAELKRDINAYDQHLNHSHVRDSQLTTNPSLLAALILTLPAMLLLPLLFLLSLPGTIMFGAVGMSATWVGKAKGVQAMLAFQSYLPVSRWPGRDVIATWKIVVSLALMPVCFLVYGTLLTLLASLNWGIIEETYGWPLTTGRLVCLWLVLSLLAMPSLAFGTVWIWEWQIDLKMQIQVWWWKLCGGNAEMKRWRADLVERVDKMVEKMGGRQAFDVSGHH